jgi:hypothetical protein
VPWSRSLVTRNRGALPASRGRLAAPLGACVNAKQSFDQAEKEGACVLQTASSAISPRNKALDECD